MKTLRAVAAVLRHERIPFALIGAAAMAVHGVSRSTADVDLLVVNRRCLQPGFWTGLEPEIKIDARSGDDDDPLAGIVRFSAAGERVVDLIVGRSSWQADCLSRASLRTDDDIPVVTRGDLILLKLYAGGPQDAWDIEQLLAANHGAEARTEVDERVIALPAEARALWAKLRG